MGQGGYDGKGVQVLRDEASINKGFDVPSVLEKMVTIQKEIAVIVAMNDKKETAVYPATEMVFDPELNLLDYQVSPTDLPDTILEEADKFDNRSDMRGRLAIARLRSLIIVVFLFYHHFVNSSPVLRDKNKKSNYFFVYYKNKIIKRKKPPEWG